MSSTKHTEGEMRIEEDKATGELYAMVGLRHILTISTNSEYKANATRICTAWNEYDSLKDQNKTLLDSIRLILDDNYQLPAWKRKQLENILRTY
jgi:hypothetical protein